MRLVLNVERDVLTIPAQAVMTGQAGTYVYVLSAGPDGPDAGRHRGAGGRRLRGDREGPHRRPARGDGRAAPPGAGRAGRDQDRGRRSGGAGGPVSISELFIKRPVMTTLVMAGILIFGIMGYRLLPVSDLPTVDFPTISVSGNLSGASPETMAAVVATPLEKAVLDHPRARPDDVQQQP